MKRVSNKEKLELYERFLQRLHFERHVSCNEKRVHEMLAMADSIVTSQGTHDYTGRPLTEDQINKNVNDALEALRKLR